MVDDRPRVVVSVVPDTARFAEVLRIFARHVLAAADDIAALDLTTSPGEQAREDIR